MPPGALAVGGSTASRLRSAAGEVGTLDYADPARPQQLREHLVQSQKLHGALAFQVVQEDACGEQIVVGLLAG